MKLEINKLERSGLMPCINTDEQATFVEAFGTDGQTIEARSRNSWKSGCKNKSKKRRIHHWIITLLWT
ncbi:hypothetical protein OWV82_022346 [Melia azedarach]|uniref:Uncharacterized protein n=1 Tax=Melia azedarach TaxID=155640 RepID=A0ACC1X4H1_MELAZ|nr:hypothetical protein OWV82_022346 [Melia azedarach]